MSGYQATEAWVRRMWALNVIRDDPGRPGRFRLSLSSLDPDDGIPARVMGENESAAYTDDIRKIVGDAPVHRAFPDDKRWVFHEPYWVTKAEAEELIKLGGDHWVEQPY